MVISWFSLEYYYIPKYRPTSGTIEAFLKNLQFPADRVISFLPTGRLETAAKELTDKSHDQITFIRLISAAVLVINVGFWIWLLFRQEDTGNTLSISIILAYMMIASLYSWRFGHKLASATN